MGVMTTTDPKTLPRGLWLPAGRRVRVKFGGETIADSTRVMLLRDAPYRLHYFFPVEDVRMDLLHETDHTTHSGWRGDTRHWTVQVGGKAAENAAWTFVSAPADRPDTNGYVTFDWSVMDAWYEEDEEVFVHPRDPFTRVDTLHSSRHVQVQIDGVTVADTTRPVLLIETGLPVRYYIPQEDVRMDLLTPTGTHSRCPYKGQASYWTVAINGKPYVDMVWGYLDPLPEIPKIKGLLSFYNEKVDMIVDEVLQARPKSKFS